MWNKNGKLFLSRQMFIRVDTSNYTLTNGKSGGFSNSTSYCSGTIPSGGYPTDISNPQTTSSYLYKYYIYVGSGDSTPTENDYTLENPVALTMSSGTITSNNTLTELAFTLINNTGSQQTIREVGLFATISSGGLMFNRKLLDSPVVMENGDIYTFTYKIDTTNLSD